MSSVDLSLVKLTVLANIGLFCEQGESVVASLTDIMKKHCWLSGDIGHFYWLQAEGASTASLESAGGGTHRRGPTQRPTSRDNSSGAERKRRQTSFIFVYLRRRTSGMLDVKMLLSGCCSFKNRPVVASVVCLQRPDDAIKVLIHTESPDRNVIRARNRNYWRERCTEPLERNTSLSPD